MISQNFLEIHQIRPNMTNRTVTHELDPELATWKQAIGQVKFAKKSI